MLDAPRRSRKEITYIVALFVCYLGLAAPIPIGWISGSTSDGLVFLFWLSFACTILFHWRLKRSEQRRRDEYALHLFTAVRSGQCLPRSLQSWSHESLLARLRFLSAPI